jgi:hypothetical protein
MSDDPTFVKIDFHKEFQSRLHNISWEPTFCITAVSKKQQVVAVKCTEGHASAGCSSLQFKGANQCILGTWYLWMEWVGVHVLETMLVTDQ